MLILHGKIYRNKLSIEHVLPGDAETILNQVQDSMTKEAPWLSRGATVTWAIERWWLIWIIDKNFFRRPELVYSLIVWFLFAHECKHFSKVKFCNMASSLLCFIYSPCRVELILLWKQLRLLYHYLFLTHCTNFLIVRLSVSF